MVFELTDDQKLQILLVGAPILSMIGTWMSLRTYARLKVRKNVADTDDTDSSGSTTQEASASQTGNAGEGDRGGH